MFVIYANNELEEKANRKMGCYRIDNNLSNLLFQNGIEEHSEYAKKKIARIKEVTGCKIQDRNFEISF